MKLSPNYSAIRDKALALLQSGVVNNHPWEELRAWAQGRYAEDRYCVRNSVDVALCMAVDEVWEREHAPLRERWKGKPPITELNKAHRRVGFTNGNFNLARSEITRTLREEQSDDRSNTSTSTT